MEEDLDTNVLLLILGIFLIFLAIAIILISNKREKESEVKFSEEFKEILKQKEFEYNQDIVERKISRINKIEKEINSEIGKEDEYESVTYNAFSKKEYNSSSSELANNATNNENYHDKSNFVTTYEDSPIEDVLPKTVNVQDKIVAHRNGRSLVTNANKSDDNIFFEIKDLESKGYSTKDIAQVLGKGIREIEIIKRLNEKS